MNPVQEPYKLVIDLGNSRAKVAVYMHDELTVIHTIADPTPEKLYQMGLHKLPIAAGIICSVSENPALYTVLFPDLIWIILESQTPLPIRNKYQTPETLGKDRLAAVSGAHFLYPGRDLLVIDAGTAVTYDFANHKGEYYGGSISPGLSMRFRALHTFTSRLPLLQAEEITYLTGCSTRESILSGVINGLTAEMDGIIDQYKLSWPSIQVVLTGGDAKYFEKTLKNSIFATPNLVLTGLKLILDFNFEK